MKQFQSRNWKSCYDSGHIRPIRAEISTHEYWENVFVLLFVWLVVIDLRQNFFRISPNFGDFGAKMSFSLYNQPKTENVYKTLPPPPVFQNTTYIRDVYLHNNNLCKWGLGTRGVGGDVLQIKNGEGLPYSTWNTVIANGKLHQCLTFW